MIWIEPNENPRIRDLPEHYIVLDIETTGLLPCYGDQVTCICAKSNSGDNIIDVQAEEYDEEALLQSFADYVWKRTEDAKNEGKGTVLIMKNGKDLDVPFFLLTCSAQYCDMDMEQIHRLIGETTHFDLHHVTSKWVGLQQMAELYGVDQKSGTGENAIKLWNEGRLDELKEYCWQDVLTTEQVFLKWKELYSGDK